MESVTSCGRAYDIIAPYRPHGLVWLLPGTAAAQGLQAQRKIQRRIAPSVISTPARGDRCRAFGRGNPLSPGRGASGLSRARRDNRAARA